MHRVMGVDIETYSSVDLAEAGVYAYVEAPDFDILLISYIFDDWGEDDVKTIDCFDADPDMMAEFCEALRDPGQGSDPVLLEAVQADPDQRPEDAQPPTA